MTEKAGQPGADTVFPCQESFIRQAPRPPSGAFSILAVDIGGTHTRAGLWAGKTCGSQDWSALADVANLDLKTDSATGHCLERMCDELFRRIACALQDSNVRAREINGVGIVWSNRLANRPLDPAAEGFSGVGGRICGIKSGSSYRKGEWWNTDLYEGLDISASFGATLRRHGFSPKALVIGNDTIFTCRACPGADSGMVASTGANITIVPPAGYILCNPEAGGNFEIPRAWLSLPSQPGSQTVKIEDVIAGVGMGACLAECLESAVKSGLPQFSSFKCLAQQLEEGNLRFRTEHISAILQGNKTALGALDCLTPEETRSLQSLTEQFVSMAGRLAGLLAFLSVSNQINTKDTFLISLDSTQARFLPGYLAAMRTALVELAPHKQIQLRLLEPNGIISVPMQGVVQAVCDFL